MIYVVYYQRFFGLLRPDEVQRRTLNFTHRRVHTLQAASREDVYRYMQAEVWSPHGEACRLIRRLRLGHTSLSVGDVIQSMTGKMWACDLRGWQPVSARGYRPSLEDRPPLWMATEAALHGPRRQIERLKISAERDCLPAAAYTVEQMGWTAFADLVSLADRIEQRLGWSVCIDLGTEFYETEPKYRSYVGYYLTGKWHNAIISVLAPSVTAAQARIEAELRKPGRRRYWQLWVRDGRPVKLKEEQANGASGR